MGWSSRTFDLLLYMIIDLKRSINLKWLLMSSAIFISDNLVASAAGNHQKLSLILLHQSSFHSDVWCGQNSSLYQVIPIARKNSDQFDYPIIHSHQHHPQCSGGLKPTTIENLNFAQSRARQKSVVQGKLIFLLFALKCCYSFEMQVNKEYL